MTTEVCRLIALSQRAKRVLELDLACCDGVKDAGLAVVGRLATPLKLGIRGCRGVDDAGLAYLSGLTALRALHGGSIGIGSAGIVHLGSLSSLEELDSATSKEKLALGPLASLVKLRSLGLSCCELAGGAAGPCMAPRRPRSADVPRPQLSHERRQCRPRLP